jgi:RNA polymerase sigma factor (sigma-70 family)
MNARPESDETLIKRLLPNNNLDPADRADAWQEWYLNIGEASVLGFIKAKNDTTEQDADILQEAMMTAYIELERGRYKPHIGVPFTAYVKGIARNKIREARRKTQRFVSIEETPQYLLESDDPQLEMAVEHREQSEALQLSLARLTAYRQQVIESYLEGNTTAEIAKSLGMTEELVRQHKSRGLRSLREMDIFSISR